MNCLGSKIKVGRFPTNFADDINKTEKKFGGARSVLSEKNYISRLKIFSFSDACNLYCRQGMVYSPKGRVKDGTKCRPGSAADNLDICIGGKCMV